MSLLDYFLGRRTAEEEKEINEVAAIHLHGYINEIVNTQQIPLSLRHIDVPNAKPHVRIPAKIGLAGGFFGMSLGVSKFFALSILTGSGIGLAVGAGVGLAAGLNELRSKEKQNGIVGAKRAKNKAIELVQELKEKNEKITHGDVMEKILQLDPTYSKKE
ncbi:MAG: hypothetical protein GOV15_03640, partial [Candidatus Diapherotrites archaeon]|nr:hypothetical protein [Candidatus Diapherotrites archaeon]